MPDRSSRLTRMPVTARFEYAVRHCPKCGWSGPVGDTTLRYCGPGQRVEEDWGQGFLFGESGADACDGPGEHFHWQCPRCRFRRPLPMPSGPGGAN